jgi:hypothetical protein
MRLKLNKQKKAQDMVTMRTPRKPEDINAEWLNAAFSEGDAIPSAMDNGIQR